LHCGRNEQGNRRNSAEEGVFRTNHPNGLPKVVRGGCPFHFIPMMSSIPGLLAGFMVHNGFFRLQKRYKLKSRTLGFPDSQESDDAQDTIKDED